MLVLIIIGIGSSVIGATFGGLLGYWLFRKMFKDVNF